ncbi:unnamed protein product, partial [Candidula unifasciata]
TFSTWMVFALPLSLLLLGVMWLWTVTVVLRCNCCLRGSKFKNEYVEKVNEMIREEYRKLGPVTYAQAVVVVSFLLMLLAWVTRDLGEAGGWRHLFPGGYVTDSTPCILFAVLMFTLPSSLPWSGIVRCHRTAPYRKITPLLTWKRLEQKMPWSLFLLLGGGFAMAKAATDSGLSAWIGSQLLVFRDLNHWVILLIICYIITFLTEVTSNTAIATLMMPILSQMATGLQLNPLFLMFPGAITTSFAFMLPVATPPNAIVFSYGIVKVVDMVISGLFLNLISVPILLFATATWGNAFFKFDQMPPEFASNVTSVLSKI